MAGIDKTYCSSYPLYREFKDWANKQFVTFFDGYKECIGNYVRDIPESEFIGEMSIMNTPTWVDIYLIQNCKFDFVLDRMRFVYGKSYDRLITINLKQKPPEDFKKNRRIKITNEILSFPKHNAAYGKCSWYLSCDQDFYYNSKNRVWSKNGSYYPDDGGSAKFKTIKAVVRHLRKQYLPLNITFTLIGGYVGEDYKISILNNRK